MLSVRLACDCLVAWPQARAVIVCSQKFVPEDQREVKFMQLREHDLVLSERFTRAVDYARRLHTEYRKGTRIPYMAHLLGVTSLVMGEAGGPIPVTEDMAIAAILHDTVEDHGGQKRLNDIEATFGKDVARMVAGLSDSFVEEHEKKEAWDVRKQKYLDRLPGEHEDALLICIADKLYNVRSIVVDYQAVGPAVFDRFKAGADQQLWYYEALLAIFKSRLGKNKMVEELGKGVDELRHLIEKDHQARPS
jgi:(p)ppGpp synthase/HD superfamily hydrolase